MQTTQCPNCGYRLEFDPSVSSVRCDCCDSSFPIDRLLNKTGATAGAGAGSAATAASIAQLIDSPDAGLVYIQNRFDNTDWEAYGETLEVIIPEIEEMVEKSKIKFGASASAWLLDFESVAYPLNKKLEGLHAKASKMSEQYSDVDLTSILMDFDLYKEVTASICDQKDMLIKRLENAVKYAEKFALEEKALSKMKEDLAAIKTALEAMEPVKNPSDVPELKAVQDKIDEEKIKEFAARGLAVKEIYSDALKMMDDKNADRNELLRRLESIRGYSNVNEKIDALNRYYVFNGEYYNFCGRSFIFKTKPKENLFDPKAISNKTKKKDEKPEEEYTGDVLHLFEVINGKPAKEPILEDITNILTVYGSRLYYVKLDSSICYFDIVTKREFELDKGKVGDYVCSTNGMSKYKVFMNGNGTAFYIRKRLPLEVLKKGCVAKLLNKQDEAIERRNNYSLLQVSLVSDFATTAVKELVDVTEYYGNNIFYTKADELDLEELKAAKKKAAAKDAATANAEEEDEEEKIKLAFRVYNMHTGEDRELLNDECEIHNVVENHVVFSKYAPNAYNKDLYVYDAENEKEVLIENNILDYFTAIKGRIYYTVGNDDYCPLFSNNLEGTDRVEVMTNIERIIAIRAGWLYVLKKIGRFNVLIKVSSDGKERMVVCLDFGCDIKVTDTYIYYIDTAGALRVARTDGKENTFIADNISASSVIVDKECIYYLRKEDVDRKKTASSLYCMDMDGHNVRKLLFDVSVIDNFDADSIMIKRTEEALFEFEIPVDNKNHTRTERHDYNLDHFCKYNKKSGELETLLTLGLPDETEYEFKGCFGKKKKFNSTYKQVPKKTTYKRANAAKAGAVFGEQAGEQGVNTVNSLNNLGGCGAGCSSIISSITSKLKK